jgi:ArsR family transcriptional regulator, arsenate/arsenite/antimonite-responsive transcriptional repressor
MKRRAAFCDLAPLFAALADVTRLRLLNLIAGREVCVCHLVDVLGQSQPKISRHLAYLRRAGVVAARREGKWMHYRMEEPKNSAMAAVMRTTLEGLNKDEAMRADRKKLKKVCCLPDVSRELVKIVH